MAKQLHKLQQVVIAAKHQSLLGFQILATTSVPWIISESMDRQTGRKV
jgi:hypothetical protein